MQTIKEQFHFWHQKSRLFTVRYFLVRSFRYTESYRHGILIFKCAEGAGVGDYSCGGGGGGGELPPKPPPWYYFWQLFYTKTQRFLNYLVYNIFTNYLLRTRSNSSLLSSPYVWNRVPRLSFTPARRDAFRTQHHFNSIPKPPNSSSRLSLISFTDLLRLHSPGLPLLTSSVWFSATVPGEVLCNALTFWTDVTVSTILLLFSQLLQDIKLLSPDKMTSFAVKLKGAPLLKGFQ